MIGLRFGIDAEPTTVAETARRLAIPRGQVRKLEERPLERLALERELQALRPAA